MTKRTPTTKDVALLWQMHKEGQLLLSPEFQRNSVWPNPAKAYLIDTILNDRPMPLFFLQRGRSAQSGKTAYSVIDGQQRLRAIFDFLDDRFPLSQSKGSTFFKKRFSELPANWQDRILDYDLIVDELSGYTDEDIRDIFVRMNRYVVKLSLQELRHAKSKGVFRDFVEEIAALPFWSAHNVFSRTQIARMRHVEYAAEIIILLAEGPQDKKASIDLYYGNYSSRFDQAKAIRSAVSGYTGWLESAVPDLKSRFVRKPVDLYGLLGAMHRLAESGQHVQRLKPAVFSQGLRRFEKALRSKAPSGEAARYIVAASRQTDNISPRLTRIEIMTKLIRGSI